ncbi:hypothetical protein B0H17DRAFT_894436, partial [Mycena rosella]
PNFDFDGFITTFAVKEGSSEVFHIDWNDLQELMSYIIVAGDFSGGEFCAAQLGGRIPLRPGMGLAARTRLLAHC